MTRRSRIRNNSQGGDVEAQRQVEGIREEGAHEMSTRTSGRNGIASGVSGSDPPARQALVDLEDWRDLEGRPGSSTRSQVQVQKDGPSDSGDDHQPGDSGTQTTDDTQPMPPMIGEFNDGSNALWSFYNKQAKRHDEARIQSLNDDMGNVLIFAGLFSAILVSFITDKIHDLQVDPAQQMVYYQQQNVAQLAQISNQISSIALAIAPQASVIPSVPTPSYPRFIPTSSDVRVNAFWLVSLVFSLSAALLATLVQQWVRDYIRAYQRYSHPLKSARLRQYLYEGVEKWYMLMTPKSAHGLVQVSLFLFFLGLWDSLLALNTTVGIAAIVPITICGLYYVHSMFTPLIDPQSPLQNPFTHILWYLKQKIHPRRYSNWNGIPRIVSSNMSYGLVQLALDGNEQRQDRDVRAIGWLMETSTEDDEMELIVMAIPGTFTSKWGVEVWSHPQGQYFFYSLMDDLCRRVRHLVNTCNNRSQFATDELWLKRSRGCVEAVASLVFHANIELERFGDLGSLLSELGGFEKTRVLSATQSDEPFVARWTYLSLLVVTRGISNHDTIKGYAREAIDCLSRFRVEDGGEQTNHDDTENALKNARWIDNQFETASQFFTRKLDGAIRPGKIGLDEVKKVLANHKADVSMLERIAPAAHQMEWIDTYLSEVNSIIRSVGHGLSVNLPGVSFDEFKETGLIQPTRFFNLSDDGQQGFTPQFIFLRQRLRLLCTFADAFRDILDDKTDGVHDKIFGSLHTLWDNANHGRSIVHQQHLMERQLWRLQDLRDNGGFGFSIELFFLVLPQLLSVASSRDTQSALYIRTLKDIASDWRQHKGSIGTQRVILNLVCDIAIPFCWSRGGVRHDT